MYIAGRVLHIAEPRSVDSLGGGSSANSELPWATDGKGRRTDPYAIGDCHRSGGQGGRWQAQWVQDPDAFQEILISSSMMSSHLPDRVFSALVMVSPPSPGTGRPAP
jgi:hypothetical protein